MPQKSDKSDQPEEIEPEKMPDRPLECSECKKPVTVHYTEIIGESLIQTCMCSECPELQRRLHGIPSGAIGANAGEMGGGIACGNCGTTLEALQVGAPLGCSSCYEVFDDVLLGELLSARKVSQRLANIKKNTPFHIGRAPGETQEMNPSMRLLALNEALNETLKREDYEQAAWLRDQIKAIETEQHGSNEKEAKNE